MSLNLNKELAALQRLTVKQLRQKYAEATNGHNRIWLLRRIIWRLQAQAEGGLSERARQRAEELANDADLRTTPPPLNVVRNTLCDSLVCVDRQVEVRQFTLEFAHGSSRS